MIWDYDGATALGRVKVVSADKTFVHVEYPNGNTAICFSEEPSDFRVGDVVFITETSLETAPPELWPSERSWVGVIKLLHATEAVVEIGSSLQIMPRPQELTLHVGNTIEGTGLETINRVVSDTPIRYLDLANVDDVTIRQFKEPPENTYSFEDFAGSAGIVARAKELIETPLKYHQELEEIGARPIKGVLFTGDPGTGKTLLARIIANRSDAVFYQISGPQIMNKWLGQSEELIRKIFEDAAKQEKAIVFFDEIDSLATQRSDDSHEASRRIVGQLLSSMDGFKRDENVVVIATTNRPQDIDSALRRPGRFDWEIHFPLPGIGDREAILRKSQPRGAAADLPHAIIAEKTDTWSPAELVAIWSEAALFAVADRRKKILEEDYLGGFEQVTTQRARKQAERTSRDEGLIQ
ncbi:ATP-binding protein [Streptomyces brevispora]|uniref:ATP-binding protein n=1 Tax=Streptomyces mutomycini TaxID=284036 RepID=A0ABW0B7M7_9ACTN|nr:ATP-binding protein [Streptomyces mutomycini]